MKVVLDTNVLIAAYATHGLCHLVLEAVLAQHTYATSPALLAEVEEKLVKKIRLPSSRSKEIIRFLKLHSEFQKDQPVSGLECRDKEDLKILSLAVNAQAEALVTGDEDLLVLKEVRGTPILKPRDFWVLLRGQPR